MQIQKVFTYCLFLLLLPIFTTPAFAQKKETYYDVHWKPCEPALACYYSVVLKTDSGYYQQDYFINGGKPQMFALFEDADCKIHNGYATWYYANGYPQHTGRFVHNLREGVALSYHPNGFLSDSGSYHNGLPVGNTYKWHFNGLMSDSVALVKDSMFVHVSWFDDGNVAEAGREINGKKFGPWVFYRHNGSKAAAEMYENDKCIRTRHYDDGANEIAVDSNRAEHPAEFKGGVDEWKNYLQNQLIWPAGYHFENGNTVVMQVQMTIDERGAITDVYVVNPFHAAFDKIAFDAIRKGPKWIPAIQHNRPVPYRFVQTVTFSEQ